MELAKANADAAADLDFQRQSRRFMEILGEIAVRDKPVPDGLLGVAQVAKRFRLSNGTIQGWIREGKLEATKVNGSWRITPEEVSRREAEWKRQPWDEPYQPKPPDTTNLAFVRGANGKPKRIRLRSK